MMMLHQLLGFKLGLMQLLVKMDLGKARCVKQLDLHCLIIFTHTVKQILFVMEKNQAELW